MSLSHTLRRRMGGCIAVVLVVSGIAAWLYAVDEGRWVGRATTRPETLNLETVEQGNLPVNQFVSLRNHWAVYREHVATFRLDATSGEGQKIETLYYPVISDMNPYLLELAGLSRAFGGIDNIPDAEWPRIEKMGVLIRTDSVESLENVPPLIEFPDGLFGTVLHAETDLPGDERELLTQRWPEIDLSRVVIINAGHRPGNVWSMLVYGGLGVVSWGLAILIAWRLWRTPRSSATSRRQGGQGAFHAQHGDSLSASSPLEAGTPFTKAKGQAPRESNERSLSYAEALGRYAPQHDAPSTSRLSDLKPAKDTAPSTGIRPQRDD